MEKLITYIEKHKLDEKLIRLIIIYLLIHIIVL